MNLNEMSEVELKAAIYDQMAMIESCQLNIKALNEALRNLKLKTANAEKGD